MFAGQLGSLSILEVSVPVRGERARIASDFTLTCRSSGVLEGSTSLDTNVCERRTLEPAYTAKHHLRLPNLYQYRSATQVADFFG
jgi:hypothetical protein